MPYSKRERIGMWLQGVPVLRHIVLIYSHSHNGVKIYHNGLTGHYVSEDRL